MSLEKAKQYLTAHGMAERVMVFDVSSATVELAAQAVGVEPARIAKTLSFECGEQCILLVTAGDSKIDNAKFKAQFGHKAKMLPPNEVERLTGYAVGGVCPFDNPAAAVCYTDISLRRFDTVYPACGSDNSAVRLTPDELFALSGSRGDVDVCKGWQPAD